jgi:hypothetical protein
VYLLSIACMCSLPHGSTGDAVCADMTNTSGQPQDGDRVGDDPARLAGAFGFTTVYGTNPTGGGMCPSLQGMLTNNVVPGANNWKHQDAP